MNAGVVQKKMPGVGAPGENKEALGGNSMSDPKTTTPVVKVEDGRATIEWDVIADGWTGWESILVEIVDGQMEISGRGEGHVAIPLENLGLVMACMVELNVRATK